MPTPDIHGGGKSTIGRNPPPSSIPPSTVSEQKNIPVIPAVRDLPPPPKPKSTKDYHETPLPPPIQYSAVNKTSVPHFEARESKTPELPPPPPGIPPPTEDAILPPPSISRDNISFPQPPGGVPLPPPPIGARMPPPPSSGVRNQIPPPPLFTISQGGFSPPPPPVMGVPPLPILGNGIPPPPSMGGSIPPPPVVRAVNPPPPLPIIQNTVLSSPPPPPPSGMLLPPPQIERKIIPPPQPSSPAETKSSDGSRNALLASIRRGKKLRSLRN
mmetsp:Transcript_26129/g.36489  ORF Transcript_26129/g.36489 Transcript_26129/m.36489 type:complete len:271 (-) Transcript_26129:263-1075(-)